MKTDFTVIIVGRENVGKSSLFNRIINQQRAIVDDYPGVTRDKIYGEAEWLGKKFNVIDTGGIMFTGTDRIKKEVIKQIESVIHEADLVVFLVDAQAGVLHDDRKILDFIKRNNSKYVVAVNKVDNEKLQNEAFEFYELGVDHIFPMTVAHSIGLDDLLDHIISLIPEQEKNESAEKLPKLAIIGKENVGKSSLFNALIKEERAIVTEIPGTTRDSVDSVLEINGKKFLLIDTAGVKKRKRIKEQPEEFSIGRSFMNIKRCDMVMLVIDAIEGIQDMDKKVLGYAYEHSKAIIIAVNKWDKVARDDREKMKEKYIHYIRSNIAFMNFAPLVFISAKEGHGLEELIDVVIYVENQYNFRVKTSVLNRVFQEAIYNKSVSSKKGDLRIYFISQVAVKPPVFALFVNKKEKIVESYLKYLENQLRENFGFEGVPLKFKIKERRKSPD
jgi:GTP-binding protein